MLPILVIKIGTSTLTAGNNRISRGKLEDLATQIVELKTKYNVVLVTSGAVATARHFFSNEAWAEKVTTKQALSAIGQPKLMQLYAEVFSDFGLRIAQCLLTYKDFDNDESKLNTSNTIKELLAHDFIPIINENDTTAVEELIVGDNDKLSALLSVLIGASKLVIASDIDGVYDKNPHLFADAELIEIINDINDLQVQVVDKENTVGTGGMTSKLLAGGICLQNAITMHIVNGSIPNAIVKCLKGSLPHTKFLRDKN
jgi:glutamate 5-kinase